MSDKASRREKLLAGVAGSTLALGLAVAVGAVPGPGVAAPVPVAAHLEQVPAAPILPQDPAPAAAAEAVVQVVPVAAPPKASTTKPAAPAAAPRSAGAAATRAPARAAARSAPVPAPAAATGAVLPVPAAAPLVTRVERRTPSSTEIKDTIAELRSRVGGLLRFVSPTAAQLNQAGNQVCTGFDNGQSFEQVRAAGLSSIPSTVKVSPENADWAVRKLVTLYCPGHAPKLA